MNFKTHPVLYWGDLEPGDRVEMPDGSAIEIVESEASGAWVSLTYRDDAGATATVDRPMFQAVS